MLAQNSEEEKGGILKYLPYFFLPMLSFTLTETVPQPFSWVPNGFPPGRYKIRYNRRYQLIFTSGPLVQTGVTVT